jgi:hypothetical protein
MLSRHPNVLRCATEGWSRVDGRRLHEGDEKALTALNVHSVRECSLRIEAKEFNLRNGSSEGVKCYAVDLFINCYCSRILNNLLPPTREI